MKSVPMTFLIAVCTFAGPVLATDAAKFKEKVVWSFGNGADGRLPDAGLIFVGGMLYGTTQGGGGVDRIGTVFRLDPNSGAEKVAYSFCGQQHCEDGAAPQAGLLERSGTLYGTTNGGGAYGHGAIFSFRPSAGAEMVVHSFAGGLDGGEPVAGLIAVKGTLYGTTIGTTYGDYETLYSLDTSTGVETPLYTFCQQQYCTDGAEPTAGVINAGGALYGTTSIGGAGWPNCDGGQCGGVVFSFDVKTRAETVLHSFGFGADGSVPLASLIDVNGTLYGTTSQGGVNRNARLCSPQLGDGQCGTVFSLNPKTGKEKVIYSFCRSNKCTDGANPLAGLIYRNGLLYGTTYAGGITNCNGYGCGTVFSLDPKTGIEKVIYAFCGQQNCTDGATPQAGLIDVNGALYGTTYYGGAYGYGTVFSLEKSR